MDDFLTWFFLLVWFFIFISQFLSKAKKQKEQSNKDVDYKNQYEIDYSEDNIRSGNYNTSEERIKDVFTELGWLEKEPEKQEITIKDKTHVEQKIRSVLANKKIDAKLNESNFVKKKEVSYSGNIKQNLKNPENLKAAIVLAEILGKPKALRGRWQRNSF